MVRYQKRILESVRKEKNLTLQNKLTHHRMLIANRSNQARYVIFNVSTYDIFFWINVKKCVCENFHVKIKIWRNFGGTHDTVDIQLFKNAWNLFRFSDAIQKCQKTISRISNLILIITKPIWLLKLLNNWSKWMVIIENFQIRVPKSLSDWQI